MSIKLSAGTWRDRDGNLHTIKEHIGAPLYCWHGEEDANEEHHSWRGDGKYSLETSDLDLIEKVEDKEPGLVIKAGKVRLRDGSTRTIARWENARDDSPVPWVDAESGACQWTIKGKDCNGMRHHDIIECLEEPKPIQMKEGIWADRYRTAWTVKRTHRLDPAFKWISSGNGKCRSWTDTGLWKLGKTDDNDLITYLGPLPKEGEPIKFEGVDNSIGLPVVNETVRLKEDPDPIRMKEGTWADATGREFAITKGPDGVWSSPLPSGIDLYWGWDDNGKSLGGDDEKYFNLVEYIAPLTEEKEEHKKSIAEVAIELLSSIDEMTEVEKIQLREGIWLDEDGHEWSVMKDLENENTWVAPVQFYTNTFSRWHDDGTFSRGTGEGYDLVEFVCGLSAIKPPMPSPYQDGPTITATHITIPLSQLGCPETHRVIDIRMTRKGDFEMYNDNLPVDCSGQWSRTAIIVEEIPKPKPLEGWFVICGDVWSERFDNKAEAKEANKHIVGSRIVFVEEREL